MRNVKKEGKERKISLDLGVKPKFREKNFCVTLNPYMGNVVRTPKDDTNQRLRSFTYVTLKATTVGVS